MTDTPKTRALSALDQLLATTGNPVSDDVAAVVQPLDPPLTDDEVHGFAELQGWPMEYHVMVLMVVRTARDG